jgi:hypothetical protein
VVSATPRDSLASYPRIGKSWRLSTTSTRIASIRSDPRKPLKTGITAPFQVIPGEDPAELEALAVEYQEQFQAATALERFLVDALISPWPLNRLLPNWLRFVRFPNPTRPVPGP